MDRVSAAQRALVAKTATEQLIKKLWEAGVPKEEVDAMNREQRMEAWAGMIADGKDVPKTPAAEASSSAMDLEREKLAFAERREAAERECQHPGMPLTALSAKPNRKPQPPPPR